MIDRTSSWGFLADEVKVMETLRIMLVDDHACFARD